MPLILFSQSALKKQPRFAYYDWCIAESAGFDCLIATPLPEPAGIYPLNGASLFTDITSKNAGGIGSGVTLAAGPDNQPDGAYEFAGNINSFIEIPQSPALNTRYSISVLAWVHHDGQSGPLVQYRRDQWGYHFWLTGPNQLFVRPQQKGIGWKPAQVYNAQLAGAWHYVGATYDSATGECHST